MRKPLPPPPSFTKPTMILRPRQQAFVDRVVKSLRDRGNTLGVAPTGCGKSVMMAAVAEKIGGRALVLQHRDELVSQNRDTFKRFWRGMESDLYTADRKRWSPGVTFSMVQTLSRGDNIGSMPKLDLIVIDEAHHVAADSYKRVIERAKEMNPDVLLCGVTATPQRGDRKGLVEVFDNVADVVSLSELIQGGFLVRPRFFVVDCAIRDALSKVRVTANDFDMAAVEAIMDKDAVTDRVITEWKAKAGDRKSVFFCSTVRHCEHVLEAFHAAGVSAAMVTGEMADGERRQVFKDFDRGITQVLLNVAVATEGWDCQPVSCVGLLRPCSYKSTMIQMIGRGLRKVDPERYPGVIKDDCIVLDFGYSLLTHGSIDTDPIINPREGKAAARKCPECGTLLPPGSIECAVCGHEIDRAEKMLADKERGVLQDFSLKEVDLLEASPFRWQDLFDGSVTLASSINAWAVLVLRAGRWHAVGRVDGSNARLLCVTGKDNRAVALAAADDFMREHGDKDAARKTKRWLTEPASEKQLAQLGLAGTMNFGLTKYLASIQMTWRFNERDIKRLVLSA